MADNVKITAGTDTDIATDQVGTDHYQKMKLADGAADSSTMVEVGVGVAANALRVALAASSEITANLSATDNAVLDGQLTALQACQTALEAALTVNLSATDNAALNAIQVAVEAVQTAIEATLTVQGTVTANLGATDNAVLDAIQTATEASQTALEILDNAISGSEMQVDIVSSAAIPVTDNAGSLTVDGTVTANLSATDNSVLDAINSNAVSMLQRLQVIDDSISGNETQVDVVGSLPAGTNAIGKLAANSGVDIGDVDVASIAAGENHLGEVGMADDVITITCSLDTSAYADGDVLFDTQEIASAVRNNGDSCILQSVHVLDKDDQGVDFELIFFNANTSLGTENSAPDIDDTEAETVIGHYAFSNDYVDLGANQIRTDEGIGLLLKAGASSTSLYVAGLSKGAGTYSASGIKIMFGFLRN